MSLEQLIQQATSDPKFAEALRTDEALKPYFANTAADLRNMQARSDRGRQTKGSCLRTTSPFN